MIVKALLTVLGSVQEVLTKAMHYKGSSSQNSISRRRLQNFLKKELSSVQIVDVTAQLDQWPSTVDCANENFEDHRDADHFSTNHTTLISDL